MGASKTPGVRPGTSTSFGPARQVEGGVLNAGHAEAGTGTLGAVRASRTGSAAAFVEERAMNLKSYSLEVGRRSVAAARLQNLVVGLV